MELLVQGAACLLHFSTLPDTTGLFTGTWAITGITNYHTHTQDCLQEHGLQLGLLFFSFFIDLIFHSLLLYFHSLFGGG